MFLTFLTKTNKWEIVYNNIHTGKRNRKSTGTNDSDIADSIFKAFEKEYNEKLLIHNSQIANNSTASNLMLNSEIPIDISEPFFKDTLKTILNYYANQNNNKAVQNDIRRNYAYLIECCGNKRLSEYKMLDFENYKSKRIKLVKAGTVNCELRNLRAYFSRLVDFELLIKHPMAKVKYLDNFNKRLEFKKNEMQLILNEVKKTNNDLMYYTINLAYLTGMRLSEIVNLKWQDVDFEEGVIYVKNYADLGFVTKSGKERAFPIEKNLKPILAELKAKDKSNNYVISKTNGFKYNPSFISLQFRQILKKLKLNDGHHAFHSLRHSYACFFINATKGDVFGLMNNLGHSKLETSQKYLHYNLENAKKQMNEINLAV